MVQRTLASKSMLHGKGGAVFASFLKLFNFALFVIPGMASRVMYSGKYMMRQNLLNWLSNKKTVVESYSISAKGRWSLITTGV